MFQRAGSAPQRALLWFVFICTFVFVWELNTRGVSGEGAAEASGTKVEKVTINKTSKVGNSSHDDLLIHKELNTLLKELRQIAESIEAVRMEQERLAHSVRDISAAVKHMNEQSEKITKKVRKLSKALKQNSNQHKFKHALKGLQNDHRKILDAVLNGLSHLPRNKTGRRHQTNESFHETRISSSTLAPTGAPAEDASRTPAGVNEDSIPEPAMQPRENASFLPADCTEVIQMGNYTSGVYSIHPKGLQAPVKVWCDHTTEGGGWTMIVARVPRESKAAQLDFNRNWEEYKRGFGDPASEHWIGNEVLHAMTSKGRAELRTNITDWGSGTAWAEWKEFKVDGEENLYTLTVGRYASGSTAGDALKWHNGMKFSTPDRDNDALMGGQCAVKNSGGWWYRGYRGCYQAHPTGKYQRNPKDAPKITKKNKESDLGPVLAWQNWQGDSFFPQKLFLMFRPALV